MKTIKVLKFQRLVTIQGLRNRFKSSGQSVWFLNAVNYGAEVLLKKKVRFS